MKSLEYRLAQLAAIPLIFRHYRNPALMMLLRLGLARMRVFPFTLRLPGGDLTMLGRPATASMADQFTLREVFLDEVYRDILPLLPPGPARVVDAGANIGAFPVWLARRHGLREAWCFEPESASLRLLRANLALNDCPAEVVPRALGGEARTLRIFPNVVHPAATNIYAQPQDGPAGEAQEVQVVALRDWLRETGGEFDLLKMDCEAAEWEIIEQTPAEDLRRFRVAIIEVHHDLRHPGRPLEEFRALMEQRGFETLHWSGTTHVLYIGRVAA